jgi:hypothetical protein
MSIWNNLAPCYKGEHVAVLSPQIEYRLLKTVNGVWDYELQTDEKLFPGVPNGLRSELLLQNVDVSCDGKFADSTDFHTWYTLKSAARWITSDRAVYGLYFAMQNKDLWKFTNPEPISKIRELVGHMLTLEGAANFANIKEWYSSTDKFHTMWTASEQMVNIISFTKRLTKARHIHSYKKHHIETLRDGVKLIKKPNGKSIKSANFDPSLVRLLSYDPKWLNVECAYRISSYRGIYYFIPKHSGSPGYLFTSKDMSRLINVAQTYMNATLYGKISEELNGISTWTASLSYLTKCIKEAVDGKSDIHRVCEAWNKANSIYYSRMAGPMAKSGTTILIQEFLDGKYDMEVDLSKHHEAITTKDPTLAVDASQVHRFMCPPAYDPTGIFVEERNLHAKPNKIGSELSAEAEEDFLRFAKYMRFAFIKAFQKRFGRNPGKAKHDEKDKGFTSKYNKDAENGKVTDVKFERSHLIDLKGCALWKSRDDDYHLYFEDTAFCADTKHGIATTNQSNKRESNQLLYMLTTGTKIDLRGAKEKLSKSEDDWGHYFRVGFKCESAKSKGRLFFIGNQIDKILFQELEENISEYLPYVAGNAIGLSDKKLVRKMAKMVSQKGDVAYDEGKGFVSFDIKAWSPHMASRFQEVQFQFWGEVFDQPHVSNMQRIYENASIFLSTLHWFSEYKLHGRNLEGMNGKMLTFGHVCVMGSSVRKSKIVGSIDRKTTIDLLALIDDGLASLISKKSLLPAYINKFAEESRKVYWHVGLEMKLSKCFLSDRFSVFLNTFSYGGAKLLTPGKVFIRLGISDKGEHVSIPERVRELHSWCLSANKNGANWVASHVAYLFELAKLMSAVDRENMPENMSGAFQMFAPVSLGGYGAVPFHLCHNTAGRLPISEAMTFLHEVAVKVSSCRPFYLHLCTAGIKLKSGASFLRAPATVTSTVPHLTEMRMLSMLEKEVSKFVSGAYVGDLLSLYSEENLHALGKSILDNYPRMSHLLIDTIYSCTPEKAVSSILSKFRKSSSIMDLLGERVVTRVIKADRAEVLRCNRAWRIAVG